ncbi:MAG: hypothetical protein ACI31R_03500 [Bacilli bacterium]
MNNKGFAVTSMVYAAIILLSMTMFTVLAIVKSEYTDQKEFVEDINKSLTQCIVSGGGC